MKTILNKRGDATVIAIGSILGIIFIAGLLVIYVMARNESERIHKEMIAELEREDQKIDLPPEALQDQDIGELDFKFKQ